MRSAKYGALSNVHFALNDNFGPPAKQRRADGHVAAWSRSARPPRSSAAAIPTSGRNIAGLAGSLTLSAGGTYVWNSPSGVFQGNWRAATEGEMTQSDKGGEGVVLLGAKSGGDWLVHKRTEEGQEGTGIMIRDLDDAQPARARARPGRSGTILRPNTGRLPMPPKPPGRGGGV